MLSITLSVPWLVLYCWRKIQQTSKGIEYDIKFTLNPPSDTKRSINIVNGIAHEKHQVLKYRHCKNELIDNIAAELGIDPSHLTITYIDINPDSNNQAACCIHIFHQFHSKYINHIDYKNIQTLYAPKHDAIAIILQTVFRISVDWSVTCTVNQGTPTSAIANEGNQKGEKRADSVRVTEMSEISIPVPGSTHLSPQLSVHRIDSISRSMDHSDDHRHCDLGSIHTIDESANEQVPDHVTENILNHGINPLRMLKPAGHNMNKKKQKKSPIANININVNLNANTNADACGCRY